MKNRFKIEKLFLVLVTIFFSFNILSQTRAYYNKYEYRKKRHEINFGGGASSCLTDLGGSDMSLNEINEKDRNRIFRSAYDVDIAKSKYVLNFSYIYHMKSRLNFRANVALASISGDDAQTAEFYRNNRNLNFTTYLLESSAIFEFYIALPSTGTKYNLRSVAGQRLSPGFFQQLGFYVFSGIGGVYYEPRAVSNLSFNNSNYWNAGFSPVSTQRSVSLRELHTEGQGMIGDPAGFPDGQTYSKFALCIPMGFGVEKAFNSYTGIKIEAGYRYTTTDYLDDVSTNYYDKDAIQATYGETAATMSGTNSGEIIKYIGYAPNGDYPIDANPDPSLGGINPYSIERSVTEAGFQRGNPENKDVYMFATLSFYKKFNSQPKAYSTILKHQKRKIKASF